MDGLEREIEATIYDFNLNNMPPKRTAKRIMALIANKEPVAEVPCSDRVSQLLCYALAIVDGKGRAIPGGSYAVWKGDWQELRDTIFKAYEICRTKDAG